MIFFFLKMPNAYLKRDQDFNHTQINQIFKIRIHFIFGAKTGIHWDNCVLTTLENKNEYEKSIFIRFIILLLLEHLNNPN
jgi:hypothetical protein